MLAATALKENLKAFLQEQGASRTRHSGRTLFDHLIGTYRLLEAWGNTQDVCDAGLFHSIYGTKHFRQQSWPIKHRGTIKELIGEHAEHLVYLFCTLDRPRVLLDSALRQGLGLAPETLAELREIEAANLLEQNATPRWLKQLFSSDISPAARAAIDAYLRGPRGREPSQVAPSQPAENPCRSKPRVVVAVTVPNDVEIAFLVNGEQVLLGEE